VTSFANKPPKQDDSFFGAVGNTIHGWVDGVASAAASLPIADAVHAAHGPAAPATAASPADLHRALGHWADDHSDQQAAAPNEAQQKMFSEFWKHPSVDHLDANGQKVMEAPHTQVAGLVNGLNYDRNWADKALPENTKLDMSTPEARLATLNHLTQNRTDTSAGEDTCAASSLVGGAIMGGGTDGIKKLIDGVDNNLSKEDRARLEGKDGTLAALRDKLKKGEPLTQGDMHQLQQDVYMSLQDTKKAEMVKRGENPDSVTPGADPDTIAKFLQNSPAMDKMMKDNHMGVSTIDMNGGGQAHAVLSIRAPDADGDAHAKSVAVYDPYARKNGQVVTDQGSLMELQLAEKHKADGKPAFEQ
jgi:hypothetical protein